MSEQEPDGPYVYQPHGTDGLQNTDRKMTGRLYGVGGLHYLAKVEGLTWEEAEAIVSALLSILIKNQIKELVRSVPEALAAVDQSKLAAKVIELQLASDRARQRQAQKIGEMPKSPLADEKPNIIRGES
jgi:hypothetical protein